MMYKPFEMEALLKKVKELLVQKCDA